MKYQWKLYRTPTGLLTCDCACGLPSAMTAIEIKLEQRFGRGVLKEFTYMYDNWSGIYIMCTKCGNEKLLREIYEYLSSIESVYFLNARERENIGSTEFWEFQTGEYTEKHWLENSMYIHDDVILEINAAEIFDTVFSSFGYYGITRVTLNEWNAMKAAAEKTGGAVKEMFSELELWAEKCLESNMCFTICGI